MKLHNLCILLFITFLPLGNSGRILFLTPMGSKSHKIFFMGITEALAERGHHVTMVSAFEPFKIKNVREVFIQNFSVDTLLSKSFEEGSSFSSFLPILTQTPQLCVDGLGQQSVQDLKNEEFDLIILSTMMNSCYLSFVHHFKIPYIFASPGAVFHDMIGSIDFPSLSAQAFVEPGLTLTFKHRLMTLLMNGFFIAMFDYYLEPRVYSVCVTSGLCPTDMPPFHEIHKNASLMIVNRVRTLEYPPRPSMPNVIYAGGAQIKAPKKLPKDLEDWVEGSGEDGFIFFSLGSALNPSFLPERYRTILVNVFGSLKQKVLWKWNEETMPDLPKNVKLQKWLPQSDLLGHPKIKLFITHGGQLSTLESSYHGVPVIGMPVFADQHSNMKIVQSEGWGRVMEWEKLEEEVFRNLIQEVLSNKKLVENAKHRSLIMQDRLVSPAEEAAYWVEYVMRHKGAPHLTSPLHMMHWYEIYNMDVWAFIILVITGLFYILWLVSKFILRRCFEIGKSKLSKRKKD